MITDDAGLQATREQLRRAEAILDATRRKVGHNPVQFHLFSSGVVDMVREMRAEIDAYLGIAPSPEAIAVSISLEGQDVALGRTSAGLITKFVDAFRRGMQAVVEALETGPRGGGRRKPVWVEQVCDLPLIGVAPGSVRVLLGRPEPDHLFGEQERRHFDQALDALFRGLEWAGEDSSPTVLEKPLDDVPVEVRRAVLDAVSRLLPPPTGPVERVAIERPDPVRPRVVRTAALERQARQRVRRELELLAPDRHLTDVEGVIRSVDLDAGTFTLRDQPGGGSDLTCDYERSDEAAVKEYLDRRVIVRGTLETNRVERRQRMRVNRIEPVAEESVGTHAEADAGGPG